MEKKEIFEEISGQFERGVYHELNLLSRKEKRLPFFEVTPSFLDDLWKECSKLMPSNDRKQFLRYLRKNSSLLEGLDYLHHHFLNGNFMFSYALNLCARNWTIQYLNERNIPFCFGISKEEVLLSFLYQFTELNSKDEYQVQSSSMEYYLYVLETNGLIIRKNYNIYLSKKGYRKAKEIEITKRH